MVDEYQSSYSNFITITLKVTILSVDFEISSVCFNHDPSPPIPLTFYVILDIFLTVYKGPLYDETHLSTI